MFSVEYRTIGRNGRTYPSNFLRIGGFGVYTCDDAKRVATKRLGPNVEIVGVEFMGALA